MKNDQDLFQVGEVIGNHGLDGELKIRPYTDKPENFFAFKTVTIRQKTLPVVNCRVHRGKVYLSLARVTKRTTAEKLLGEKVYIFRDQTESPEEDEYFIVDLLGANILEKDTLNKIGTLKDVKQSGVVDNFEIQLEDKTILVPALKEYFEVVDLETIYANIPEEFFEL